YSAYIFQPADSLQPEEYVKHAEYSFDEIADFLYALQDSLNDKRTYVTGSHCKDCKGKIVCNAFNDYVHHVVNADIKGMTNKDLGRAMDFIPSLEKYIKEVREATYRNVFDGVSVPGWKLEDGEGNTIYKDENAAGAALGRLGISAKERNVVKPISAPQALKLLKERGVDDKQIKRFKNNHTLRPLTAPRLVRAVPGEDLSGLDRLAAIV
ncbi:MAG: DUF2800 domain-containing protein, partial [Alphaproteobacteria bacterium]